MQISRLLVVSLVAGQFLSLLAQTWTGTQSVATSPITVNSPSSFTSTGLSAAATTSSATDAVLLVINLNVLPTTSVDDVYFTILRDTVDLSTAGHSMVDINPSAATESQSGTFSFMDVPGAAGTFTYSLVGKSKGIISSSNQLSQIGALLIPSALPTKLSTIYISQTISTTTYQDLGLSAIITPGSATDKVLVSATFSINPTAANAAAVISLYRNGVKIDTAAMQIIAMGDAGSNRQCTIFYLDTPNTAAAVMYSISAALFASNSATFSICESNTDIAHINVLSVPALNAVSAQSEVPLTVSSTSWSSVGLMATITPLSTSDQVLVTVNINFSPTQATTTGIFTIFRTNSSGSVNLGGTYGLQVMKIPNAQESASATMSFLDSPTSSTPVTYTVMARVLSAGTFVVSASNQLRQLALVASSANTVAPSVAPTAAPSGPTRAPTVTNVAITQGNLYKTVTVPSLFTMTFGLTVLSDTSNVAKNVWDLRDSVTNQVLLSQTRVSNTNTVWTYNGTVIAASGASGSIISSGSIGGTSMITTYTLIMQASSLTVRSSGQTIATATVPVASKVDTAGRTYNLYVSNPTDTSSGGIFYEFSISVLTDAPTVGPTATPAPSRPTQNPTKIPTLNPTNPPSLMPTLNPTIEPSVNPSRNPTAAPSVNPTRSPTVNPTAQPTFGPTQNPTAGPSCNPSCNPTASPSKNPTKDPTQNPSVFPTAIPTVNPTQSPSGNPTKNPTAKPTAAPSGTPIANPTALPTVNPSTNPSVAPSALPTLVPSAAPSYAPVANPSAGPTPLAFTSPPPTVLPTVEPTDTPPSVPPTLMPTGLPSVPPTLEPTFLPSVAPVTNPTASPSLEPSAQPVAEPTEIPSFEPSAAPVPDITVKPTAGPSFEPSETPTVGPTDAPIPAPTVGPSAPPTSSPQVDVTGEPSETPTVGPTDAPVPAPTVGPSVPPTSSPQADVTEAPTVPPTVLLTKTPVADVTAAPSLEPSASPVADPTIAPSTAPTSALTAEPTVLPTASPTSAPSESPSELSTALPTDAPIAEPSALPSFRPSDAPTMPPTRSPSVPPSAVPSAPPSVHPTAGPSETPTLRPSAGPSAVPSRKPTAAPTVQATDAAGIVVPGTPQLNSAVFSNDGTNVLVSFTSDTNKAGYFSQFPCSAVLTFTGASTASCTWASASVITVYPSSATLSVGSPVAVNSNSSLRAACPASVAAGVCALWSQVTTAPVSIQAPPSPARPSVVISMAPVLSGCSPLSIDLSASSGSGGRVWLAPAFTVTSFEGDGTAVAAYLNKNYTFSGAISVPSGLFPANGVYTIGATLSNFLGASATASQSVTVTKSSDVYPTVSIPGLEKRTVSVNAALLLTSSAYTVDCSGVKTTNNLAYAWTVTIDGVVQSALVSQSSDPSKFRLAAYSLAPLKTYAIIVTVTNTLSGKSSKSTVTVFVQQGALVAQVGGGSTQAVVIGSSLTLDASSSYDQDMASRTGSAAGLSFAWTCSQTAPLVSSACPLSLTGASAQTLVVTANSGAASSTSRLTVTVFDNTRNSTATVLIATQDSSAPLVTITTSTASVKSVNTQSRLTLAASVTVQSSCTAQWSVDDSSIALATSALSAVSTVIPVGTTRALNLVLAASVLPQRSSLVFTLTCGASSTEVTVTTNGPPQPGVFTVTPASGVELTTSFTFSAMFWSDPDLPITYQFGFVSASSASTLTLNGRSEASSAVNTLAAGPASSQNAVSCSVQVFDVLNAVATTTSAVTVAPQTNAAVLQATLVAQLSASAGNTDGTKAAISIGSAVINAVSCAAAPACAPLNRASCAKVQNTCGACLIGYLGDAGDKNSQCVSATSTGGLHVGSSCGTDSDCGGFLACNTALAAPVCYLPAKRCTDDCSGQGTCVALNANSNKQITSCSAGDSSCIVSCVCAATYSGANCGTTEADLVQKQELRSQYLQSLATVASAEDVDSASVAALTSSLSALTQNSYELSGASVDLINQVANSVLTSAAGLEDFTYDQAIGVLSAIDAAATATVRMNTTNTVAFANQMMDTIALFNSLVSSQLVAGQDAVSYIQDSFRTSAIRKLRGFNSSIQIVSPSTLLEASNGGRTSSVSIDAASTGSRLLSADVDDEEEEEFAVNMVVTAAASYGEEGSSFNSNPVQVTVSRTSTAPTRVTFVLAHNEAADFTSREEAHEMGFNSTCTGLTDRSVYNFTCPLSGEVLSHNCTGLNGVMSSFCPVRAPTCAIVNGTTGAVVTNSSDCEVLAFDLYSTTCSCLILPSAEATVRSRRLSLSDLEQSGLLDAVSVTVYMGSEFKNTFNSYDDINSLEALKRVLIVILMFCTLWAGGLLLIFGMTWRRNAMKKTNKKVDTRLEKKVQVAQVVRSPAVVRQYLTEYVILTFPSVFSNKPFFSRLYGEIKRHHRYLTLFTAPQGESGDKQRILTGVQLLSIQTMLMFLLAMLYDVQSPSDDGTCVTMTVEDCLKRKSVFDTTVSYCKLTENADQSFSCMYRDPEFSFKVILYISVIVAVLVAIISYPSDYIFELLSAPVADEQKAATQDTTFKQIGRRASNVARRASNVAMSAVAAAKGRVNGNTFIAGSTTRKLPGATEAAHALATASMTVIAENSRRTIMSRQMTRMRSYQQSTSVKNDNLLSAEEVHSSDSDSDSDSEQSGSDNEVEARGAELTAGSAKARTGSASSAGSPHMTLEDPAVAAQMSKLTEEINCQRRLLKPSEVEEFDTQWGLDPTGEFTLGERSAMPCMSGRPGAEETILKELKYVTKESNHKAEKLNIATDAHTGLEILHLFIMDLLGRGTPAAIIFETKSEEDFQHTKVVTRNTKRLAALALFGINAFFVYYSILTGFRKGVHWQQIFLVACIVQFIVEVVLFETMECVWINCAIPVLVSDEVRRVGESIIDVVQELCSDTPADSRFFLNVPDYLFVSTNVAKKYPHLMESILVQAYNTHLPGELARKWQTGSIARVARHRRMRSVTFFGTILRVLQYLGTAPFLAHKVFIRFLQPFVFSGLALLWNLIVSNVIYIAVAVFVLLVILAYGLYRRYQEKALIEKCQNVTPVSAEYISSKSDDTVQNDDDLHVPTINLLPSMMLRAQGSGDDSLDSEEEKDSDGEQDHHVCHDYADHDNHSELSSLVSAARRANHRAPASVGASEYDPAVSDDVVSSTDLSKPLHSPPRDSHRVVGGLDASVSSQQHVSELGDAVTMSSDSSVHSASAPRPRALCTGSVLLRYASSSEGHSMSDDSASIDGAKQQ